MVVRVRFKRLFSFVEDCSDKYYDSTYPIDSTERLHLPLARTRLAIGTVDVDLRCSV